MIGSRKCAWDSKEIQSEFLPTRRVEWSNPWEILQQRVVSVHTRVVGYDGS